MDGHWICARMRRVELYLFAICLGDIVLLRNEKDSLHHARMSLQSTLSVHVFSYCIPLECELQYSSYGYGAFKVSSARDVLCRETCSVLL